MLNLKLTNIHCNCLICLCLYLSPTVCLSVCLPAEVLWKQHYFTMLSPPPPLPQTPSLTHPPLHPFPICSEVDFCPHVCSAVNIYNACENSHPNQAFTSIHQTLIKKCINTWQWWLTELAKNHNNTTELWRRLAWTMIVRPISYVLNQ